MRRLISSWQSTFKTLGFKRTLRKPAKRRRSSQKFARRGPIEALEERSMLAITVNSLLDNTTAGDNLTTLREAVIAANANADADMIEFDASLTASGPATIELSQGELTLSNNVGIVGPGAGLLTIDANGSTTSPSRHFTLNAGRVGTISGVMLTGGYVTGAEDGGSIRNLAGDLTLESVVLVGNHTADYGGAIYSSGPLDITSSTLERNTSELTGGAVVITTNAADGLVIKASSFIDNEAGQRAVHHRKRRRLCVDRQ